MPLPFTIPLDLGLANFFCKDPDKCFRPVGHTVIVCITLSLSHWAIEFLCVFCMCYTTGVTMVYESSHRQMNGHGCVPIKLRLWTQKFKFHIVSTQHDFFFFFSTT